MVRDYPLAGCGLGAFGQAFPRYRTFLPELAVDTVHNDYLQFLAELGAIGFAIAACGVIVILLSAADGAFRNADASSRYIAIASLAALVAILIHSFTDYNLYIPANAMLLAWIAGIVASLNFGSKELFTTCPAKHHRSTPCRRSCYRISRMIAVRLRSGGVARDRTR